MTVVKDYPAVLSNILVSITISRKSPQVEGVVKDNNAESVLRIILPTDACLCER